MKAWCYKAIIFWALLTGQSSFCQPIGKDLVFDHISRKQGLPDNLINTVYQDSRGFLWLATNRGLSRYDGRSFKNYTTLGAKGITDLIVHNITEDKKGNIWFGTESGLNKLNPFTEIITQYPEGSGPGKIPYRWCNYLYMDKDKGLWLTTEKGLALYNERSDSFENFPVIVFGKDDRINKFINKIVEDSTGKLWLSTSYGVKAFDKKTKTYTSYFPLKKNAKGAFYSLFIDHAGTLWAGTFSDGLFRFNASVNNFESVNLDGVDPNTFAINDIAEIKMQNRWYLLLATYGGLVSFKQGDKENLNLSYSLAGYNLTQFFTDRQQNLWVGSWQGLFKLNPNSFAFKWIPLNENNKKGTQVFHIIPAVKNRATDFYLTTTGGWYNYNTASQTIAQHYLPAGKEQLLANINRWISDDNGYWFTSVNGLGYYDVSNNTVQDLTPLVIKASAQKTTGYIVKATDKSFWTTMKRSGILVFDQQTKKDTVIFGDKTKPDNTYGNSIADMQKDADGNVWFTSGNKLYRVDPFNFSYKTFLAPPPDEQVAETKISPKGMLFTKNGRLLVCSQLCIYEFKNDRLVTLYPLKGFSNFSIEKITEDQEANLWVKASEGVFKTDENFTRWEAMSKLPGWEDGTIISEIHTTNREEILFASDTKIGVLKEKLLQKSRAPLPVIISRVRYGVKEDHLVSLQKQPIKSSYKDAVEIELSPVDFIAEKENRIFYQLRGWDDEWKELGGGSMVRYEQLPAGDYTFVTKSVSASGMESAETNISFTVVPPFYRTWWFVGLIIILFAAATFLFYRFRLKKALELERIRTRIATDLHDDIGATLSSISLYSQALKGQLKETNPNLERVLDKMGENSRDMVASMSDIVWAINPDNDEGEKLVKRMESYAADMCAVKNIKLHFSTDEKLNHLLLPLEHRKNIYLIFKEAINNTVKYAQANAVWVKIVLQNKNLTMTITDDGIGFDEASVKKGNGLKNLYSRALEINGSLHIKSAAGEGTTITLHCPV
ncbi:MAG: hypothetical protein IPL54_14695 [Chitinophagaceae bacterium]|nr:hypothetical protein [Chitinophagaceae bacterium]